VVATFSFVLRKTLKNMRGYGHKPTARERILLVDDNHFGLSVRKVVLEELGYAVTAVCCSLEAFRTFCSEGFELVVTDYRMPNLNGIELIERIRSKNPNVPIVLISGLAETLGLNQQNTGADIIVQKNAHEVVALTRAVVRLLARRVPKKAVRRQTPATTSNASAR
jgi:CheY-like chemotaxis protein